MLKTSELHLPTQGSEYLTELLPFQMREQVVTIQKFRMNITVDQEEQVHLLKEFHLLMLEEIHTQGIQIHLRDLHQLIQINLRGQTAALVLEVDLIVAGLHTQEIVGQQEDQLLLAHFLLQVVAASLVEANLRVIPREAVAGLRDQVQVHDLLDPQGVVVSN